MSFPQGWESRTRRWREQSWLLDRFAGKLARSGVRHIGINGEGRFEPGA